MRAPWTAARRRVRRRAGQGASPRASTPRPGHCRRERGEGDGRVGAACHGRTGDPGGEHGHGGRTPRPDGQAAGAADQGGGQGRPPCRHAQGRRHGAAPAAGTHGARAHMTRGHNGRPATHALTHAVMGTGRRRRASRSRASLTIRSRSWRAAATARARRRRRPTAWPGAAGRASAARSAKRTTRRSAKTTPSRRPTTSCTATLAAAAGVRAAAAAAARAMATPRTKRRRRTTRTTRTARRSTSRTCSTPPPARRTRACAR